jgi:hypothetical protein
VRQESSRTHDVFLSYSSKDKNWADAACAVLERYRIRCWIAPRDITPGHEWGAAIVKGLKGSRIMVLIFSGHANASGQVRREVERAISQGMTILPVRVEDVRPEGAMEYALGNTHWLDAFTPPVERQLELLARSVKTLLGKDARPVAAAAPSEPAEEAEDPAATPATGRSRALWPIAIAASLIGLVTLVVLLITSQAMNGESRTTVSDNSPGQVVRESGRAVSDRAKVGSARNATKTADSSRSTPQAPAALPAQIPPAGPARLARMSSQDPWAVDRDELTCGGRNGIIVFGDEGWTDYDFTFEVCASASASRDGQIKIGFRVIKGIKGYILGLGPNAIVQNLFLWSPDQGSDVWAKPSTIQPNEWYRIEISLRGPRIAIKIDDHLLLDLTDDYSERGNVALHSLNCTGRFRNIKVTAPDGTVLWEGLPDLPIQ